MEPKSFHRKLAAILSADVAGYSKIEPVYEKLPGWAKPTAGVTSFEKLPQKARDYLKFLEKESGARIGMVSTGPDRDQTIYIDEFLDAVAAARPDKPARAK